MSVSPFIPEVSLLFLLSVLKISSTNLMRTSSDDASILSLGGRGRVGEWEREREGGREGGREGVWEGGREGVWERGREGGWEVEMEKLTHT